MKKNNNKKKKRKNNKTTTTIDLYANIMKRGHAANEKNGGKILKNETIIKDNNLNKTFIENKIYEKKY